MYDVPNPEWFDEMRLEGWITKHSVRNSGKMPRHVDKYYFSPEKRRFRSRQEIERYLQADRRKVPKGATKSLLNESVDGQKAVDSKADTRITRAVMGKSCTSSLPGHIPGASVVLMQQGTGVTETSKILVLEEPKVIMQKRVRCKVCEACRRDDCGICRACVDKSKFGGPNTLKQGCLARRCRALTMPAGAASV